jgi:hypothetical protein
LVRARSTMARYLGAAGMCNHRTAQAGTRNNCLAPAATASPTTHNTSTGKHLGCAATARTKI